MNYKILPPEELIQTTVRLPLSKSESARRLILDAMAGTDTPVADVADCDDTRALQTALKTTQGTVDVGPAGTAMRFLAAYYASKPGVDVTLDGSERMRRRPIAPLAEALRKLGAEIEYDRHPPLHIRGRQLTGGTVDINASVSSQFISALMMAAPAMQAPLTINLQGLATSMPYARMTAQMLAMRGVEVDIAPSSQGVTTVTVANTPVNAPTPTAVEPDWSAASYWYEIVALSAGWVELPGLRPSTLQGDSAMVAIGKRLGVDTTFGADDCPDGAELSANPDADAHINLDMADTPDLVQTVAVTAALLGIHFTLTGVHTLRKKETDRLEALCRECAKLGLLVRAEGDDRLVWEGERAPIFDTPVIDTYGDHRMAMAFAPVALYAPGIVIRDAQVVTKSYPQFWQHLTDAGFTLEEVAD